MYSNNGLKAKRNPSGKSYLLGLSLVPTVGCGPCPQAESTLTRSWLAAQGPAFASQSRGADATSSGAVPSGRSRPASQGLLALGSAALAPGPSSSSVGSWGHLQLGPAHIPSRRVVRPQASVRRREGPRFPRGRWEMASLRGQRQGRLVLSPTVCLQIGSTSRGRGPGPPPSCPCSTSSTARRPAPARGATTWRCGPTPRSTAFRMRPVTTTRPRTRVGPPPASLFPGQPRLLSLVGVPGEAQTCGFRGAGSWSP